MIPQPNLFVLGPPRTGTTSLARWLSATPDIDVCKPKEPAYHALDLPMVDRVADETAYLDSFDATRDVRYRCDATPWYLYSIKAPASIHGMSPDARLIIRLRNPVDMLASLHNHHRYVGLERQRDFTKAVFEQRPPDATDFRTSLDYLAVARVGEQAQRYIQTFSREQVWFMRFEDAARDPAQSHLGVLEWLGLPPTPLESYEHLNRSRRPRVARLRPVSDWLTNAARPHVVRAAGHRLRRANTARNTPSVPLSTRRRILDELSEDLALLSQLTGHNVKAWWS